MNVLIIDPLSPIGHANFNFSLISILSKVGNCEAIVSNIMKRELVERGIRDDAIKWEYSTSNDIGEIAKRHKSKIVYHVIYFFSRINLYLHIIEKSKSYDCMVFTSVDINAFSIMSHFIPRQTIVFDHGISNIDTNYFYRLRWKATSRKVKLAVFEEYINHMAKNHLKRKNIFTIHHPLPRISNVKTKEHDNNIYIYAPSASNNFDFVGQLLESNIPDGMQFLIKGLKNVKKKGIEVYSNRITNEQYTYYLSMADYILIPYYENYNYKQSGVMFEALQLNKKVLLLNNNTLNNYKNKFPEMIILFDNIQEMFEKAKKYDEIMFKDSIFAEYSDDAIRASFLECINS